MLDDQNSAESLLSKVRQLLPKALKKANSANGFATRWNLISSKLAQLPSCLSDLSSHPYFSKHPLSIDLLQSVADALSDVVSLADSSGNVSSGKLRMQSDLDALVGKLELSLRDCGLLVKSDVLGETSFTLQDDPELAIGGLRELLPRLQIGDSEAKHRALDGLLEAMREDEKSVVAAMGRSNVSALVQLLSATSFRVREKAATAVCLLTESGNCEDLLVSEGVIQPLVRLLDSGSLVAQEKAVLTLQRLSTAAETARAIAEHGGILPLVDICQVGDSILQPAAAGTLRNLAAVPEIRQSLADERVVPAMIGLLDMGVVFESKEYAADCLQNLTSSSDNLRLLVISEGGIQSLLCCLDGPMPQEYAVNALRNLVHLASPESLVSLGVVPRLIHVLKEGSSGVKQAAATAICRISSSAEIMRLVGEFRGIPLLVKLLEAATNGAREAAAQAIACLMNYPQNVSEIKKNEKSVPNLVQLLDPSPQNTAKKYAVSSLLNLSVSKKCKKTMISYGAIGYLKKLSDMDIPGAKKLLERLERGGMQSLFTKK